MPAEPTYPPRIEHQKTVHDVIDARIALFEESAAYAKVVWVTTGDEARPLVGDLDTVLWVGGSVEPTNMGAHDIHLASA